VLMPDEPEVFGLLALMRIHDARRAARRDRGELVLLKDQDRTRWDHAQIEQGRAALRRALALKGRGAYVLQAAIADLQTDDPIDWPQVADLYTTLAALTGSPVVELNRAVAVGMAEGPQAGLAIVDSLMEEPALKTYHLLPSVRGDLLFKLGRHAEARAAFEAAAALTGNRREQEFLRRRAAACSQA